MKDGSGNNKLMRMVSEIGYEVMRPSRRAKQNWPSFWILGFLGSCLFIFCGICLITGFIEETKKDSGMLYCGIFFLLLGLGLLVAVIGTFWIFIIGRNTDFSIDIEIEQAMRKKKYSAERLAWNVYNGRNNVVIINTQNGFFRFYGYSGRFIAEIRIVSYEDFSTYHLIDPKQMDDSVTVLTTLFERFPTRKNRIVSNSMVVSAVHKLYETQSLDQMILCFPCVDTTVETKKLVMKDAYIVPDVPIVNVSPTSEEGRKKNMREQIAMRELQKTD